MFCFIVSFSGCAEKDKQKEDESEMLEIKEKGKQTFESKKLEIEGEIQFVTIVGTKFYYFQDVESEKDYCDQILYEYDVVTDEIYEMGKIQNVATYLPSYALVGHKIFFTRGCADDAKTWNTHYEIDMEQRKIQVIKEDISEMYHPLVESYSVNDNQFIEFVVEYLEDGYRYEINISNLENEGREVIATEYRIINGVPEGNLIVSVFVKDKNLHTLEFSASSQEYYVCSYDWDGTLLSRESIEELNKFLRINSDSSGEQESLWEMKSFHDYYFFTTINSNTLLLKRNNDQYETISDVTIGNMEYISFVGGNSAKQNEYVFFERSSEKFYMLHADKGEFEELKLDVDGITYGVYADDKLVYTTDDGSVYYVEKPYE